jgi:uncharacterized oxidoreductase
MPTFSAAALTDLISRMCVAGGSSQAEAAQVAEQLVTANLYGHDSHGIGMMPHYVKSLFDGKLRPNVEPEVVSDRGAYLLIDANWGYGQTVAKRAMELGIAKARDIGIAVVALRNAHHIGRVGAWGEMCAAAGFVSIHYVNVTSGHLVAPFGGSDARFSTNPYVTAFPATPGNPPIIFDMATSKVAMGKVRVAFNKGVEVDDHTLIDAQGRETRDPGVMYREPKGALMAAGLHKGYGLALACELLAGAFTGGGTNLPARHAPPTITNNMLTIILDPTMFGERAAFEREIDAFTAWVKASPPAPGVKAVQVPGDPERASRAVREKNGIPVDDETWSQLLEAAQRVGLNRTEIAALA